MTTTYIGPMPVRNQPFDPAWVAAYEAWCAESRRVGGLTVSATVNDVTRSSGLHLHGVPDPRRITKAQLDHAWQALRDQHPERISIRHDKGITTYDGRTMTVYEDGLPVFESGPGGTYTDRTTLADCV